MLAVPRHYPVKGRSATAAAPERHITALGIRTSDQICHVCETLYRNCNALSDIGGAQCVRSHRLNAAEVAHY